jgi:hypothetical protein
LAVGSWVLLTSEDSFAGHKPMAPGMLRRITAISGNRVTLDSSLHRALSASPQLRPVSLASPVSVTGGAFEHADKLTNFYPAVTLHYVNAPVIKTEIRNHGAGGVHPNGTVGGALDLVVHDLVDDGSGSRFGGGRHQGYGVEAVGPTRDLTVSGECWAVRHCFTTNAAYWVIDDSIRGHGDPENITVSMNVHDTTSTGLDTHEPGWNISFAGSTVTNPGRYRAAGSTSGKEGGSGVFVRARGTRVEGIVIRGAMDDGITIARPAPESSAWQSDEWPLIRNAQIIGGNGTNGIAAYQTTRIGSAVIIASTKSSVGIRVDSVAKGTCIDGVKIDLGGVSGGIGILNAGNAVVGSVQYVGVARPTS